MRGFKGGNRQAMRDLAKVLREAKDVTNRLKIQAIEF